MHNDNYMQVVYCVMEMYGNSHDRLHSVYADYEKACEAVNTLKQNELWATYYVDTMKVIYD